MEAKVFKIVDEGGAFDAGHVGRREAGRAAAEPPGRRAAGGDALRSSVHQGECVILHAPQRPSARVLFVDGQLAGPAQFYSLQGVTVRKTHYRSSVLHGYSGISMQWARCSRRRSMFAAWRIAHGGAFIQAEASRNGVATARCDDRCAGALRRTQVASQELRLAVGLRTYMGRRCNAVLARRRVR